LADDWHVDLGVVGSADAVAAEPQADEPAGEVVGDRWRLRYTVGNPTSLSAVETALACSAAAPA
jgi:hypothetical protein